MTNIIINIRHEELSLVELLNQARKEANALDGEFARSQGPYGSISKAIRHTLAVALLKAFYPSRTFEEAEEIAERIYDEVIDNGENFQYNIDLWNNNLIQLY